MVEENMEYKLKPHDLTLEQKFQLEEVIKSFDNFGEKGLGPTSLDKHSIQLVEGAVPVNYRYYPISSAIQDIVYKEIEI